MTRIFTDDSEVKDQPSIGGNSRFPRKCNNAVTFWHTLSTGKVRPVGGRAKKLKEKMHDPAHLPVLENFWPTNLRMIRNETCAAGESETSSTDR